MSLNTIKQYLISRLKITFIKIFDDSLLHNHKKNTLTHLRIIIVSSNFNQHSMITRHRIVFDLLSEIKQERIYSITLNTHSPLEWETQQNKKICSSKCLKK
jgi:BolA protein